MNYKFIPAGADKPKILKLFFTKSTRNLLFKVAQLTLADCQYLITPLNFFLFFHLTYMFLLLQHIDKQPIRIWKIELV